MDNRGTLYETEQAVKFADHWRAEIPTKGFEWIEGFEAFTRDVRIPDLFLIRKPGPIHHVPFPEDLYCSFANLQDTPDAILAFASEHGGLRLVGSHFHRRADGKACEGQPLAEWKREIRRFHQTLDLWFTKRDVGVLKTANLMLSPSLRAAPRCALNCDIPGAGLPDFSSQTRATLRQMKNGPITLLVSSTDFLTTVWLQFAAHIAGERILKKCEAPDCGAYMDVSDSPRPGAKRMHRRCEERLRKQRYRENKRKEGRQ